MRQFSSTLTDPNNFQVHVSNNIVSNCKAHMSRLKFYHLQVYDEFPDPPANATPSTLTRSRFRSSQDRLHWIHTQEDSTRFSWPCYIAVKCQGLKTWVRVLQRQECQHQQKIHWTYQLLCFTKHNNLTNKPYQQSRICQVPLCDTTTS